MSDERAPCVPCGGSGRIKGDGAQFVCSACNGSGRRRDPNASAPRKPLRRIDDLLTDDEREQLTADLIEMAKRRRRAEGAAADVRLD